MPYCIPGCVKLYTRLRHIVYPAAPYLLTSHTECVSSLPVRWPDVLSGWKWQFHSWTFFHSSVFRKFLLVFFFLTIHPPFYPSFQQLSFLSLLLSFETCICPPLFPFIIPLSFPFWLASFHTYVEFSFFYLSVFFFF